MTPKKTTTLAMPNVSPDPREPLSADQNDPTTELESKLKKTFGPTTTQLTVDTPQGTTIPAAVPDPVESQHAVFVAGYVTPTGHAGGKRPLSKTRAKQIFCLADSDFVGLEYDGKYSDDSLFHQHLVKMRRLFFSARLR
jgi:hypothetical protein